VDAVIALAPPVEPHFLWRPQLRDPNDEMVLEVAINGGPMRW
jgi:predicted nucleic acid-binding protein